MMLPPLQTIAVIIPYFQTEAGILRRAILSVLAQRLPKAMRVHIIVVDDGSPVSAASEMEGIAFEEVFLLTILVQPNGGVGTARNRALSAVPADTDVIAFLDSDDTWREGHIAKGLEALASGYDFYFCDNVREGHHASHFVADEGLIMTHVADASEPSLIALSTSDMATLILRDFPCQMSTVMYCYAIAPQARFDTSFRYAGEDVVFFLQVVPHARNVCFSTACMVHCGKGINLYFSNMGWECEGYFRRLLDDTRAHQMLASHAHLSAQDKAWNRKYIRSHQQQIVFFSLRYFVKNKGQWPVELAGLMHEDRHLRHWFWIWAIYVTAGRLLGFYKPF